MNHFKWLLENRENGVYMIQFNRHVRYACYKSYVGIPKEVILSAKEMHETLLK
jgi:hypothetical protein